MRILDILCSPWAIEPSRLNEITQIYNTHLKGEKIDLRVLEDKTGRELPYKHPGVQVDNGVAILPVEGVIAKRMNLLTNISGGTSTELLARDFVAAVEDPTVSAVLFLIDSPGGGVDGVQELSELIYKRRAEKKIYAISDGMICSAAYWIGSAAERVFITSDTVAVGSIGVVAQHVDISGMEKMNGIKTTEIYAGKYKRIASQYEPLTEEGRATIQEMVDYIYSTFVEDVARNRGVEVDEVLAKMADGRVFIGKQAIEAGLVDGVSTVAALVKALGIKRDKVMISAAVKARVMLKREAGRAISE
jgi:signal peptide peptidase SppA